MEYRLGVSGTVRWLVCDRQIAKTKQEVAFIWDGYKWGDLAASRTFSRPRVWIDRLEATLARGVSDDGTVIAGGD